MTMKRILKLIPFALLMTLFVFSACESNNAEDKIEEIGEDISDIFRTEQEELDADLRDLREDIGVRISEINEEIESAGEDAQSELQEQLDKLNTWASQVDESIEATGNALEKDWEEFKNKMSRSINQIKEDLDDAME